MLFDRKWDLCSLEAVIAWLKTKPANEWYDYSDSARCAGGQYIKEKGLGPHVHYEDILDGPTDRPTNGPASRTAVFNTDQLRAGRPSDWTFGKALARAEKLQAERLAA
jgi:hypothetical protein